MTILWMILGAMGSGALLRAILLLFFAEIGRKQDLIKHVYKSGTDFHLAVVVSFLDGEKIGSLHDLIRALGKQDYPTQRTGIHIITTEETAFALPDKEDWPANVKVWVYPARQVQRDTAVSWLVQRLLAVGGPSRLFAFLDAGDIVRPDFLRNITSRAFDCFAMQGYVALKRPPSQPLASVVALSTRLINRIENAGRFHLGLSCRLMQSGWVVRQELLEMLPFSQGQDMDNLEYTILLNLHGYRVNWAPNVVVYRDETVRFSALMKDIVQSSLNRLRLLARYSLPLLVKGITRLDFNLFALLWDLIRPPHFVAGLVAAAIMAMAYGAQDAGLFQTAGLFLVGILATQLLSLAVARCNVRDIALFLLATPVVYTIGLLAYPAYLALTVAESLSFLKPKPRRQAVGKRFDESRPAASKDIADNGARTASRRTRFPGQATSREGMAPLFHLDDRLSYEQHAVPEPMAPDTQGDAGFSIADMVESADGFAALYAQKLDEVETQVAPSVSHTEPVFEEAAPTLKLRPYSPLSDSDEQGRTSVLPISNGKSVVDCVIQTFIDYDAQNAPWYCLVFSYKSLSFTTQKYPLLDQAYYELLTKLQSRGFSIVSCGSCSYFHRPGNSIQHSGEASRYGICLFGRMTDPGDSGEKQVSVVSQACQQYADRTRDNRPDSLIGKTLQQAI